MRTARTSSSAPAEHTTVRRAAPAPARNSPASPRTANWPKARGGGRRASSAVFSKVLTVGRAISKTLPTMLSCRHQCFRRFLPLGGRSRDPVDHGHRIRERRGHPDPRSARPILHGTSPMSDTCDAVVIGAGIVGAAAAAALASDGLRVTVVESSVVGGGATAAGMGHIVVMDDSEAQFALTRYSRDLWNAMQTPPQVEFERRGTLWVAADEEELAEVWRKAEFYAARGVRAEILDARALADAEPNLRPG